MPYGYTKKNATLDKSYPAINEIVRGLMKDQRMTQRKLGKMVGWHNTTINGMLKRRTWNIAELLVIGKALNTDLLSYYYPVPPAPVVPATDLQSAQEEIERLKADMKTKDDELLKLRTENAVLREVMTGRR